MRAHRKLGIALVFAAVAFAGVSAGELLARDQDGAGPAKPAKAPEAKSPPGLIQWFATWEQGLAEAKRTRRPILLVAAAPHCHETSGLW